MTVDGDRWVLLNAAPDLRAQIAATVALHPRRDPRDGPPGSARDSPIAAVVLTGAEIDQTAGLLTLRERQAFTLYGTSEALAAIDGNPMFDTLASDLVPRRRMALDAPFAPLPGLTATLFAVPGKAPLYLEGDAPAIGIEDGTTVGVEIRADGTRLVFVPGAAAVPPELCARLARADIVLFDGTLFSDDEMIASGTGHKTGRRMGHVPIDGPGGTLAALDGIAGRRVFIHVNNTNPILIAGSPERHRVEAAGWQVGWDGMEIAL